MPRPPLSTLSPRDGPPQQGHDCLSPHHSCKHVTGACPFSISPTDKRGSRCHPFPPAPLHLCLAETKKGGGNRVTPAGMGRFLLPPAIGVRTKPLHLRSTSRHIILSRSPHPLSRTSATRVVAMAHGALPHPNTTLTTMIPSWCYQFMHHLVWPPQNPSLNHPDRLHMSNPSHLPSAIATTELDL